MKEMQFKKAKAISYWGGEVKKKKKNRQFLS